MTTWAEAWDQLQNPSAGDAVGGSPFDLWPILLPIVVIIGLVGLVLAAIKARKASTNQAGGES